MTETTLQPPSQGEDHQVHPTDLLLHLIVTMLAPMFLGVTAGNVELARMAALETVNAYQARNHADLIAIAQIVACGLAALGSLSLSMADDISVNMALRLRGNANALNRTAEQNRRVLREPAPAAPPDEQIDEAYEAAVIAEVEATQKRSAEVLSALQNPAPAPKAQTPNGFATSPFPPPAAALRYTARPPG